MAKSPRDAIFTRLTGLPATPPGFFDRQALRAEWVRVNETCQEDFDRLIQADSRIEFIEAVVSKHERFVQVVVRDLSADYSNIPKEIGAMPVRISNTKVDSLPRGPKPTPAA